MLRGADLLVQTLKAAGVDWVSALSGNQIMSVFDASIDAGVELIHVRHEAAAVHMADGWGRLTGRSGVALVTAGPGFANCLSALYVARMAESPLVLLSGHAPHDQQGRGAFQEMPQAEMASHVAKASWTVTNAETLSDDLVRALSLSTRGRPGPVHVSVPVDVLEAISTQPLAVTDPFPTLDAQPAACCFADARACLDALADAERPLVVVGPSLCRGAMRTTLDSFSRATGIPVVAMESPRGVNDPGLGAVVEILRPADAVLLLGKKLDFTLQANAEPVFQPTSRLLQIDAEQTALDLTRSVVEPSRLLLSAVADPVSSLAVLTEAARQRNWSPGTWFEDVQTAVAYRPPAWRDVHSAAHGPLHPVEVCRGIQEFLNDDDAVFISDGGEFGQWAQACISAEHQVINGPSGAIGSAIPFALAARLAFPQSRIVATLGDGTFGFHAMEFDTAVRYRLPFIAIVGNDAAWNAEYQIQLRKYGPERTVGCELSPTRYDRVVETLGGHGEHVSNPDEVLPALQRAESSGLPACVNVTIQRTGAPVIRRNG